MLSDGMKDEGYRTAWGVYNVTYQTKGYWFRTPEAWEIDGNFRASMYMRPAAIWAMEMLKPPEMKCLSAGKGLNFMTLATVDEFVASRQPFA